MKHTKRLRLAIGIVRKSVQISILFSLNQSRVHTMSINRQLTNNCAQPSAQRSGAGVIGELSGWLTIIPSF